MCRNVWCFELPSTLEGATYDKGMNFRKTLVYPIVTQDLNTRKVCAILVSKASMDDQKAQHDYWWQGSMLRVRPGNKALAFQVAHWSVFKPEKDSHKQVKLFSMLKKRSTRSFYLPDRLLTDSSKWKWPVVWRIESDDLVQKLSTIGSSNTTTRRIKYRSSSVMLWLEK